MGVDVVLRSEKGEQLGIVIDENDAFARALLAASAGDYSTLSRIDIYRTNELPAGENILSDLLRLRDSVGEPADRVQIGQILSLLRQSAHHPGSYVEFIGD